MHSFLRALPFWSTSFVLYKIGKATKQTQRGSFQETKTKENKKRVKGGPRVDQTVPAKKMYIRCSQKKTKIETVVKASRK